jgi:hypothetical protein
MAGDFLAAIRDIVLIAYFSLQMLDGWLKYQASKEKEG